MSKIYLSRHAQASIGKANYDVLSTKGEKQAAELGKYLCEEKLIFDRGPRKLFESPQAEVCPMLRT